MPDPLSDESLEAVIETIATEARNNPAFAARLRAALADTPEGQASSATAKANPRSRLPVEAAFHAVVVLRDEGAGLLRGRLERLGTKAEIKAVAKRSGLVLTGAAAKRTATVAELVDGVVRAAEHYNAQRKAAAR